MSKNNGACKAYKIVRMVVMIVATVLTIAGLVWGAAISYSKVNNTYKEQQQIKKKVELHDTAITILTTKLEVMHTDIKEINAKLR